MALWAAFGGVANARGHPASNQLLVATMPERRMALAYGMKQGAAPLASFIAGLAVPAVALTVGWRWAFVCGAVLAALLLMAVPRLAVPSGTRAGLRAVRSARIPPRHRLTLVNIAVVNFLAAGAATTTVSYAVTGAVHRGLSPAASGVLLTAASMIGGVCRVGFGALADRGIANALPAIAAIQTVGAAGTLLMAYPSEAFITGLAAAVGIGWSWPGLMHYVVSRMLPDAAVTATGMVSVGTAVGNAAVPLLIGLTYNQEHDSGTWLILTGLMGGAAVLCWISSARPHSA
jgi:predicted MFS family arabinose efflux permease